MVLITWINNNFEGVYKRGVAVGAVVMWGNLNGIMSSNIYRDTDAPWYRVGHCIVLGYVAVGLVGGSILNVTLLSLENRKRDLAASTAKEDDKTSAEEEEIRTDHHPDFRYTL